jgi:Tfp pilus assembly protein FimT
MKGFTLIELVMMVALLGIMVVFYLESSGDMSDVAIDGASRKIQSDLRYAQQLALTSGVNHGGKFNAGGNYEIYRSAIGNPVKDPTTRQSLIEDFSKYPGVSIQTARQIEFNSSGIPVMGADQRIRLLADSGATRDVYVVDKTGAVIVDLINYGSGCSCELCY